LLILAANHQDQLKMGSNGHAGRKVELKLGTIYKLSEIKEDSFIPHPQLFLTKAKKILFLA
jgi:hypothetical protein